MSRGPRNGGLMTPSELTRRQFIRTSAFGAAAMASSSMAQRQAAFGERTITGADGGWKTFSLNQGWLFGGRMKGNAALQPGFDDAAFARVNLPHCVAKLSWQNWDPANWEDIWIYRRHLRLPKELARQRLFLHFDGVLTGATPVVNGRSLPERLGGYLPFQYEITEFVREGDNVLAVAVDSRWSNVPPEGSPRGPRSIDYLEPGGIPRPVRLFAAPQIFISGVFAKPLSVLDGERRVEVSYTINAAALPPQAIRIEAALVDRDRVLARAARSLRLEKTGETKTTLTLSGLGNVRLWDADAPALYDVVSTLFVSHKLAHQRQTRIGFRDARFEIDGFFLNGRRLRLFGLDRHELFPYVGFAMPRRVLRRDAAILRHEFNCNFVRCSHYPQSEAFIEACDELGLMVWEELPGWQYLGDAAWRELAVRDIRDMVRRDRNHPSVVIWGVRINESANDPALYRRTKEAANALDGSRPTSGTMTRRSTQSWLQDVFAYDDYHRAPGGGVDIAEPLPGVPYFVTEAVGQFNYQTGRGFGSRYRRAGDLSLQEQQAILHAQAHSRGASHARLAGVVAWCAFDYGSLLNSYDGVKCPGIADVFRIPKLGAAFYQAQADPDVRPVVEPAFYWDFGPETPSGPGGNAAIFSNCERLELFINGKFHAAARPDRANFEHVKYPPFFVNLAMDGFGKPELRIDGYVGDRVALSRSFSSDRAKDQLLLRADDSKLIADGSDATRLAFYAADRFGALRSFTGGSVTLRVAGPGVIVGDNPFSLAETGGAGAVWIKTVKDRPGLVKVTATHSWLGAEYVHILVKPPGAEHRL